ncbi:MAG: DUF177 domain-containing protein [Dehalococcoidia bacterium]
MAQQLKGPLGSIKTYDIEGELDCPGDIGPVTVEGPVSLMRTDEGILVSGTLSASIRCTCVRCLSPFVLPTELAVEEEYIPIAEVPAGPAHKALEAERLVINEQHMLDLEPALREYAILSTPMKPLCSQECAGLCSICGANLNEGECHCTGKKESRTGAHRPDADIKTTRLKTA